jgi:hypothetical protein
LNVVAREQRPFNIQETDQIRQYAERAYRHCSLMIFVSDMLTRIGVTSLLYGDI